MSGDWTDNIDDAVVVSGEIDMEMDATDMHQKAGDLLVQRGTMHNWVNQGTAPCVIAFILIAAAGDTVVGQVSICFCLAYGGERWPG